MFRVLLALAVLIGSAASGMPWIGSVLPAQTDAGGLWDPDGGRVQTDAGGRWDPDGTPRAQTDTGGLWDPNG
jgi:hypothetical protein